MGWDLEICHVIVRSIVLNNRYCFETIDLLFTFVDGGGESGHKIGHFCGPHK